MRQTAQVVAYLDGQQFLLDTPLEDAATPLTVVLNCPSDHELFAPTSHQLPTANHQAAFRSPDRYTFHMRSVADDLRRESMQTTIFKPLLK